MGPGSCHDQIPIEIPVIHTKQPEADPRLTNMNGQIRPIAVTAVRIGLSVAVAMFLILGLLPATLDAQVALR
jgi:hypothetical protein